MNEAYFLKLQNGSDIRGVAVSVPGEAPINLTLGAANNIGQSYVDWVSEKLGKPASEIKIGIGRDSRISGEELCGAICDGILSTGAYVVDCGHATTPSMFMSILYPETQFDASIMITASHLPYNRNGMKFFTKDGGLDKGDITAILKNAATKDDLFPNEEQAKNFDRFNLIELYAADLREKIKAGVQAKDYEHPLCNLKIIVDAGNGEGGFFATKILEPLGADITGSQFLEPDGMFPNHVPNPEDKEAMAAVVKATVENKADLGLIFDTDVDRMSAVLADGTPINRDGLIAMMAAILAPDYPGSTIVTDSVTSDRLKDFLELELGLKHLCFKRGYKNVINKCKELNEQGIESPLAIETSGHGAMKENYYLDDGAYQAVKLLIALAKRRQEGKSIESLTEKMSFAFADVEQRIKIEEEDYKEYGRQMLEKFKTNAQKEGVALVESYEGVRISVDQEGVKGWALLRASLHDPVLVLNVEGRNQAECDTILKLVKKLIENE
ncbi:phosphomannomutase/phosphoglucomutase [Eubacterium oxidoreducens]|uniref:Phosphomannomutase n=1 Tax=Eubacterium oxidoreducens TaxID=1732 RepID=A0A1G6BWY5_EUBOX|nr:phosphomannomutase/phosphoglucomutase [Eubacterium oxidoreducens]SDB25139.1 Phosphomannomutase [Eubacterium oxidoreducens]